MPYEFSNPLAQLSGSWFQNRTRRTMRRAAWGKSTSKFHFDGEYNEVTGNYYHDQPEGWCTRTRIHGSTEVWPFTAMYDSGQSPTIAFSGGTAFGPSIKFTNSSGNEETITPNVEATIMSTTATSGEAYTNPYSNHTDWFSATPNDGYWYINWWAKSGGYGGASSNPEMSAWLFAGERNGFTSDVFHANHSFEEATAVNDDLSNPKTGATGYYRQVTCTSSWQNFGFACRFDGSAENELLCPRFDLDSGTGGSGTQRIWMSRIIIQPYNISLGNHGIDGNSTQANSSIPSTF